MNDKLDQIIQTSKLSYEESQKRMQNIVNSLQVFCQFSKSIFMWFWNDFLLKDSNPVKSLNRIEESLNSPNMQKEILELIEKVYFSNSHQESRKDDSDDDDREQNKQTSNERDTNIVEYEIRVIIN